MKIFNSYSRKVEKFTEVEKGRVSIYLCGPTVYDVPHLGHGRSAVTFDFLRRVLIFLGYKVNFVSNYTDIDDKMINRANEEGITVLELAKKIIPKYRESYEKLNIQEADLHPMATEYVDKMIEMIVEMSKNDVAYKIDDGWYFDVKKFAQYGKLKGQSLDDLMAGVRVDINDQKRNSQDFVLWKFKKENEPFWESKILGDGRPGWHIECSAMINQIFNSKTIDIHGGGEDLLFPHHDCEIAQTQSLQKNVLSNYWMHNAFVMVNNEKMSKSLKNFKTLEDVFEEYDPLVIRFFYLQVHYRRPLDFHNEALIQAKNTLKKIWNFNYNLENSRPASLKDNEDLQKKANGFESVMIDELGNDLKAERVLTGLFEIIGIYNKLLAKGGVSANDLKALKNCIQKFNDVFAVLREINVNEAVKNKVMEQIKKRSEYRNKKDFASADKIRDEILKDFDIQLIDKPDGSTDWVLN